MRVAILILTLSMASSEAGHAQAVEVHDSPAFGNAVATLAMNNPGPALLTTSLYQASRYPASAGRLIRTANVPQLATTRAELTPVSNAGRGTAVSQPSSALPSSGPARSVSDHLLTGLVAVMLIAYQLRRKHRVLRPHPFTH
jgi:hypothetical protein